MSLVDEPKAWKNKPDGQYLKTYTGDLVLGEDYDLIEYGYPDSKTEVITYKLSANVVRVITVVYLTGSKNDIDTVTFT